MAVMYSQQSVMHHVAIDLSGRVFKNLRSEMAQVATLLAYIWEVPVSSLDRCTIYPDCLLQWCSSASAGNSEIVTLTRLL
jgi:hypothetical protein